MILVPKTARGLEKRLLLDPRQQAMDDSPPNRSSSELSYSTHILKRSAVI
jgi:hypothetical protein